MRAKVNPASSASRARRTSVAASCSSLERAYPISAMLSLHSPGRSLWTRPGFSLAPFNVVPASGEARLFPVHGVDLLRPDGQDDARTLDARCGIEGDVDIALHRAVHEEVPVADLLDDADALPVGPHDLHPLAHLRPIQRLLLCG